MGEKGLVVSWRCRLPPPLLGTAAQLAGGKVWTAARPTLSFLDPSQVDAILSKDGNIITVGLGYTRGDKGSVTFQRLAPSGPVICR